MDDRTQPARPTAACAAADTTGQPEPGSPSSRAAAQAPVPADPRVAEPTLNGEELVEAGYGHGV